MYMRYPAIAIRFSPYEATVTAGVLGIVLDDFWSIITEKEPDLCLTWRRTLGQESLDVVLTKTERAGDSVKT